MSAKKKPQAQPTELKTISLSWKQYDEIYDSAHAIVEIAFLCKKAGGRRRISRPGFRNYLPPVG
jgi:hypothetical protein